MHSRPLLATVLAAYTPKITRASDATSTGVSVTPPLQRGRVMPPSCWVERLGPPPKNRRDRFAAPYRPNTMTSHVTGEAAALDQLARRGFREGFRVVEGGLQTITTGKVLQPTELVIREAYRFEGVSDPDDHDDGRPGGTGRRVRRVRGSREVRRAREDSLGFRRAAADTRDVTSSPRLRALCPKEPATCA